MQRKELNELLTSNSTAVNYSLFYRVFALASVDAIFTIPLGVFVIYCNAVHARVYPYVSWAEVHWGFSRVDTFTNEEFYKIFHRTGWTVFLRLWRQWVNVFCAVVFLAVCGTTMDLVHFYCDAFRTLAGLCGIRCKRTSNDVEKQTSILFASAGDVEGKVSRSTASATDVYVSSVLSCLVQI